MEDTFLWHRLTWYLNDWVAYKNATTVYINLTKLWRELSDTLGDDHPLTKKTLKHAVDIMFHVPGFKVSLDL